MKNFIEIIEQPWPWYVSGPLLGLIVPLLLVFGNKQFGVSSSFRHLCAATGAKSIEYFNYDWKKKGSWQLLFVLGVFVSTFKSPTVVCVSKEFPHAQVTFANLYSGCIPFFILLNPFNVQIEPSNLRYNFNLSKFNSK